MLEVYSPAPIKRARPLEYDDCVTQNNMLTTNKRAHLPPLTSVLPCTRRRAAKPLSPKPRSGKSKTPTNEPSSPISHRAKSRSYTLSYWTPSEDSSLREAVEAVTTSSFTGGPVWKRVAARLPGRSPRQCRSRWNLYLDPDLCSGAFLEAESACVFKAYETFGPQWAKVAAVVNFWRKENNHSGIRNDLIVHRHVKHLKKTREQPTFVSTSNPVNPLDSNSYVDFTEDKLFTLVDDISDALQAQPQQPPLTLLCQAEHGFTAGYQNTTNIKVKPVLSVSLHTDFFPRTQFRFKPHKRNPVMLK